MRASAKASVEPFPLPAGRRKGETRGKVKLLSKGCGAPSGRHQPIPIIPISAELWEFIWLISCSRRLNWLV